MAVNALASCSAEASSEMKALYRDTILSEARDISISASRDTVQVNTYIHVLTNGTTVEEGHLSSEQLDAQMIVLNEIFGRHSIQFTLLETQYIQNESWAHGESRNEMMVTLRKGSYSDLNLYFLKSMGGEVTGQCTFPLNLADYVDPDLMLGIDGCVAVSDTVPGGSYPGKHDGLNAVHEVGHWFGLIHVFNDVCGDDGDLVDDTPSQATESYGCPVGKDSCPDLPGLDSIHNYMDYTDDACQTEFTLGQVARMHDMWTAFRAPHMSNISATI